MHVGIENVENGWLVTVTGPGVERWAYQTLNEAIDFAKAELSRVSHRSFDLGVE